MNLQQKPSTTLEPLNSLIYERHPLMHESQYMTNSFARISVRDSLTNLMKKNVGCKVLHFIDNEDQEALGYKTLRRKDAVASFRENKALVTFCMFSPCILLCDGL